MNPPVDSTEQPSAQKAGDYEYYKNSDVRKEQKEIVYDLIDRLLTRGVTRPAAIHESLKMNTPAFHLNKRTFFRYLAAVKRRRHEEVKQKIGIAKTVEESAYELKKSVDEVLKELWRQYQAPVILDVTCPNQTCKTQFQIKSKFAATVKVAALKEIREGTESLLKTMQSLGLVHTAPEQHQILGADGQPIDPSAVNINLLDQKFTAFINATYKDPVGAGKEEALK